MERNSNREEKNPSSKKSDLKDSPRDTERLRKEETTIDLPEVKDIPGQEHIHIPPLGELADTTISSADEEGNGVLDDLNSEDNSRIRMGTEADLTAAERTMLERGDNSAPTEDEGRLQRASLDSTDFDGDPLNEMSFGQDRSGSDLDVPGSEADNINESIGAEDEENNPYSLGSESNDQVVEGTP
jgi:hypothetical protein